MKTLSVMLAYSVLLLACEKSAPPSASEPKTILDSSWVQIAQTTEGGAISIDPALTTTDATTHLADVSVRVRHQYLDGWRVELPDYVGETAFHTERVHLRFDCATKTMAIVSREALNADGDVIDRRDTPEPIVMTAVRVGGIGEVTLPRACLTP